MVELLIRGDDGGGSLSANRAIVECHRYGVLNNASVMAVGSALTDAAERFAGLAGLCVGLHVTLNSEWTFPRFRPCLPAEQVASLLDEDGAFLPSPRHLAERGFDRTEAVNEVRAQLVRLRASGLSPSYMDEHMGVGWVSGLADALASMCDQEGLVYARHNATPLPQIDPSVMPRGTTSRAESWQRRIEAAPTGRHVLVTHPLANDDEARAIYGPTSPPGTVAEDRDVDRRALLDPGLIAFCRSGRVSLQRYGGSQGTRLRTT